MKCVDTPYVHLENKIVMDIIKYFDIDINTKEMISVVGGGGKTTTMFNLAFELKRLNKRVLVTTTTAIYNPNRELYDNIVVLDDNKSIEDNWQKGTITVLGRCISTENKILGVDGSFLNYVFSKSLFDFILVEADGSKKKPIKAPDSHEPVIPSNTSKVIGIIGMDSLGKIIDEANVHRSEIFCDITNSSMGDIITEETIARLIVSEVGLFKGTPIDSKKYLLLNKADTELLMNKASLIGSMIKNKCYSINGLLVGSMAQKRIRSI